jgi:hypothetical protein
MAKDWNNNTQWAGAEHTGPPRPGQACRSRRFPIAEFGVSARRLG